MNPRPLGLFDSGVGGLTVWRQVVQALPHEDLIYFADQSHCPYGARPPEEIRALAMQAVKFLLSRDAKAIVVACNTASAVALDFLRVTLPDTPFIGMEPAVKPAAERTRAGKIGVLSTRGTLQGDLYQRTLRRVAADIDVVACTPEGLVERIEAGDIDSPEVEAVLRRYVEPLVDAGVDELVLGCTHYPFVAPALRRIVGESIALIDPSPAVARQVAALIDARDLRNESTHTPVYRFFTSGDPHQFGVVINKLIDIQVTVDSALSPQRSVCD